ncbi:MAG: hydrolase, partial [Bacteroidales bacterium]|nr:hydrolase [Bacteroidales bacterium]
GPRPFSRETAVVMMVDSVEAASRSLKNHSEEVISKLVDGIIDSQIADDQFSNSDITFRDVNKIKAILKKKLQSIYHVRVEYPVNVVKNENKQ